MISAMISAPAPTFLWMVCFLSVVPGVLLLTGGAAGPAKWGALIRQPRRELRDLLRVEAVLRDLEETLGAGLMPDAARWSLLETLPSPWARLASDGIRELRSRGGAVLPSLRRFRVLAAGHREALSQARAKGAQAFAQALVSCLLLPLFAGILYLLLPGVAECPWTWGIACGIGMCFSLAGAFWMLKISDSARWAGLTVSERSWILAAQCAGERLIALVRGGSPADLAWTGSLEFLKGVAPELAREWGFSVWARDSETSKSPEVKDSRGTDSSARGRLLDLGQVFRRSVQASVMEGRPCTERIEWALHGFGQDIAACIERELQLVSTRVLKPLFICVAPGLLGLLGLGLYLSFMQSGIQGGAPGGLDGF